MTCTLSLVGGYLDGVFPPTVRKMQLRPTSHPDPLVVMAETIMTNWSLDITSFCSFPFILTLGRVLLPCWRAQAVWQWRTMLYRCHHNPALLNWGWRAVEKPRLACWLPQFTYICCINSSSTKVFPHATNQQGCFLSIFHHSACSTI